MQVRLAGVLWRVENSRAVDSAAGEGESCRSLNAIVSGSG